MDHFNFPLAIVSGFIGYFWVYTALLTYELNYLADLKVSLWDNNKRPFTIKIYFVVYFILGFILGGLIGGTQ